MPSSGWWAASASAIGRAAPGVRRLGFVDAARRCLPARRSRDQSAAVRDRSEHQVGRRAAARPAAGDHRVRALEGWRRVPGSAFRRRNRPRSSAPCSSSCCGIPAQAAALASAPRSSRAHYHRAKPAGVGGRGPRRRLADAGASPSRDASRRALRRQRNFRGQRGGRAAPHGLAGSRALGAGAAASPRARNPRLAGRGGGARDSRAGRPPAGREPARRRDPALAGAPRRAAGDLPRPPELAVRLQERRARGVACARAGDRRDRTALPRAGRRPAAHPWCSGLPADHRRLRGGEAPVRGGAAAFPRARWSWCGTRSGCRRPHPCGTPRSARRWSTAGRTSWSSRRRACIRRRAMRILLQAAAQVPDATFVLAGDGPLRAELEAEARDLGVADRCVFLGQRADVPALLAAADLFVLPSLFEGLPVSVLEAMAAERPVVATAIGGTDEAITREEQRDCSSRRGIPPRSRRPSAGSRPIPELARRLAAAGARAGRARVLLRGDGAGRSWRSTTRYWRKPVAAMAAETPEQEACNARLRRVRLAVPASLAPPAPRALPRGRRPWPTRWRASPTRS